MLQCLIRAHIRLDSFLVLLFSVFVLAESRTKTQPPQEEPTGTQLSKHSVSCWILGSRKKEQADLSLTLCLDPKHLGFTFR
jgi:hypothetical protein